VNPRLGTGKKGKGVKTKRHMALVRELRRLLTMGDNAASFGHIFADKDDPLPTSEREVTPFIERRTRLWRQSWVFPLLDELEGKVRS
jgi:hypothetical protein